MNEKSNPSSAADSRSSGLVKWLIGVALLISSLAAGGVGYMYYRYEMVLGPKLAAEKAAADQFNTQIQNLQNRDAEFEAQLAIQKEAFTEGVEKQVEDLAEVEDIVRSNNEAFQIQFEKLMESTAVSFQESKQGMDSLILEELVFLLSIAESRLKNTGDLQSAIKLRQVARDQLALSSDPRVIPVRNTIDEEISQLSAVESVNVTDIAKQILTLAEVASTLPFKEPFKEKETESQSAETPVNGDEDMSALESAAWEIFADFKSLIKIQKVDDDAALLPSPEQKASLVENMRQSLLAAQLAVLHNQPDVFRENLSYVQNLLDKYFLSGSSQVVAFSKSLRDLSKIDFQTNIPNVSASLEQLRLIQTTDLAR